MKKNAEPESVARFIASNADDVLLALFRHEQMKKQRTKSAGRIPDSIADSYFFSNPYGLDFRTWLGTRGMSPEEDMEDVPTEAMPESEDEAPEYDSETEAGYMPNAPDESTEPTVSPASPVPLPHNRQKKEAALLHTVAQQTLLARGILKKAEETNPLRQKVAEYLRRKAAAEEKLVGGRADGVPDSAVDPKQLAMGTKTEMEHTDSKSVAKEEAKDHLVEIKDYYTRLDKMEETAKREGMKAAAMKFGLDASELLGQDEQRKDDLHQQAIRHNEENHQIELAKGQLELQQAQETFQMKQQQQAQKNQEQQAQQQMAMQMQQQQQQQQRMQYMSNMAGGGQPQQGQPQQQPPQQGMQYR